MKNTSSSVRLYAILARKSSVAVVFRRGPSNSVLLTQWNTDNDTFEHGQWLRGRIYERRCDLSPDGALLLYFAGKYKSRFVPGLQSAVHHISKRLHCGLKAMDGAAEDILNRKPRLRLAIATGKCHWEKVSRFQTG
jgi:hypothetical protein